MDEEGRKFEYEYRKERYEAHPCAALENASYLADGPIKNRTPQVVGFELGSSSVST